jgi:hypothetical protein
MDKCSYHGYSFSKSRLGFRPRYVRLAHACCDKDLEAQVFKTDHQEIAQLGRSGQLISILTNLATKFTGHGRNGEYCAIVYPYQEGAICLEDAALVKPWKLYNSILDGIRY